MFTRNHYARLASVGMLSLVLLLAVSAPAFAQTVNAEGIIKSRSGAAMILQTPDSQELVVLLTDFTKVGQVQGLLKARKKEMSMAALIPGLEVKVQGAYNNQNQLVANSVAFKGNDLERAQSIQAGMHETQAKVQQHKEELEKQSAALESQKEELKQQQEELSAQQKKITANKDAIATAIARFGQLDDYYIFDEVTVYFGNGKSAVEPQYKPKLTALAEKAKTVDAYMIQIVGYASSTGGVALNQKLSEDRAHSVANFLVQQCNIPLTNMLAPGAMGQSRQVGNDKSAEGQAQNRRVVVRVLQNKGISGPSGL